MIVPRETAGWVLDFLESAAAALAVDDAARAESELSRRVDRALAQLDKAAQHAALDVAYGAWMGAEAWDPFVAALEAAERALHDAQQARAREQLWKHFHRAVDHVTSALDFSRVIWLSLPPELDERSVEADA